MKSWLLFVTDNVLKKYTDFPSTKLSVRCTCIIIIIIIIIIKSKRVISIVQLKTPHFIHSSHC